MLLKLTEFNFRILCHICYFSSHDPLHWTGSLASPSNYHELQWQCSEKNGRIITNLDVCRLGPCLKSWMRPARWGRCAADPSDAACALVVWFWSLVAGAPCHGRLTLAMVAAGGPPVPCHGWASEAAWSRARQDGWRLDLWSGGGGVRLSRESERAKRVYVSCGLGR